MMAHSLGIVWKYIQNMDNGQMGELPNVHGKEPGCSSESSVEACRGEFSSLFDALENLETARGSSCCILLHHVASIILKPSPMTVPEMLQ